MHLTLNTGTRSPYSSTAFQPLRPLLEKLECEATNSACVQGIHAISKSGAWSII